MSLAELTGWCDQQFGPVCPESDHRPRQFDVPWLVMDSVSARRRFGWTPRKRLETILEEIAGHVRTIRSGLTSAVFCDRQSPLTAKPLELLSVVIPARNEEACICSIDRAPRPGLRLNNIPHEIVRGRRRTDQPGRA